MQAVYDTDTGELVSLGTVVADPLPPELSQVTLTAQEEDGLAEGSMMWDAATHSVVTNPNWVDPGIAEGNKTAIETNLEQDLVELQATLGATNALINSNPAPHIKAADRALRRLIKHQLGDFSVPE